MLKVIATIGTIQVIAILINIVRSKATAVILGPEGVGIISVIDQTISFVIQLSAFSLPFAAVKFLSRSHSRSRDAFQKTYASFLRLLLIATGTGALVSIFLVLWKPVILGPGLVEYQGLIVIGLVAMPVMALHGFFKNTLAAAQEVKRSAFYDVIIAGALTTGVVIGILLADVRGYYIGLLLAGVLLVLGTTAFLKTKFNLSLLTSGHRIRDELRTSPDIIPFAAILYISSFVTPLSLLIARYAVLSETGEAGAGLLHAAMALALALGLVLSPANGLYLTPILNRDIPIDEKFKASLSFQKKLLMALGILAVPIVLFPDWLLILLFSPSFAEISQSVYLFVVAQVVVQIAGVYQAILIGIDRLKPYGILVVGTNIVFGVLSWILVPQFGINGVAYGFLIANLILCASTMGYLVLKHDMTMPLVIPSGIIYILGVLLFFGYATKNFSASDPIVIVIKIVLWFAFAVTLLLLFLDLSERKQLFNQMIVMKNRIIGQK